jgi:hypothetical protein
MSEETRKVLAMLSEGKVSVQEAEQLLEAIDAPSPRPEPKAEPRYFRIQVNKPARDGGPARVVNIRVPITLVRGGLRLGSLFPGVVGKSRIALGDGAELDLSKVSAENLEAMIKDIGELTIDVNGHEQVRIRCE